MVKCIRLNRTKAEQETVFLMTDIDGLVHISSTSPIMIRRLKRRFGEPRSITKYPDGSPATHFWEIPSQTFRWGKKRVVRHKPGNLEKAHAARMAKC